MAFFHSLVIVAVLLRPVVPVLKNFSVVNEVFVVIYHVSISLL